MVELNCTTWWARIYISGPLHRIEDCCREFCQVGACVTVTPTKFIYRGGEESGAVVGLLNYPRFPKDIEFLVANAEHLARRLLDCTYQDSVLLQTADKTLWISKREL